MENTHNMLSLICKQIKKDQKRNVEKMKKQIWKNAAAKILCSAVAFTDKMSSLICNLKS